MLFATSRYKNQTRVELSYPEIGDRTITKEEYIDSKWTRVNLRRKVGQPKSPNGPTQKFNSRVKTHFLYWNLSIANFLSLNLITLMLELLIDLVTPILECAGK